MARCLSLYYARLSLYYARFYKNPEDQRFIVKSTEQLSQADIDELPSLSTGEALISGRSIPAPLLVRVGMKALLHGGESPRILDEWGPGRLL